MNRKNLSPTRREALKPRIVSKSCFPFIEDARKEDKDSFKTQELFLSLVPLPSEGRG
jgi:hypothetical protein